MKPLGIAGMTLLLAAMASSQTVPPVLSTGDKTALSAMELKKQEAQRQWNDANQTELAIEREFAAAHPGYKINPQTFVIEADKPEPAKTDKR